MFFFFFNLFFFNFFFFNFFFRIAYKQALLDIEALKKRLKIAEDNAIVEKREKEKLKLSTDSNGNGEQYCL